MQTNCRKCGSADTQSFLMAYNAGTSKGSLALAGVGTGGLGVATGGIQTTSGIASKLAPPKENLAIGKILLLVATPVAIPFIVLAAGFSAYAAAVSALLIPVGAVLAIVVYTKEAKKARERFAKEQNKWDRSWICLRCGSDWVAR